MALTAVCHLGVRFRLDHQSENQCRDSRGQAGESPAEDCSHADRGPVCVCIMLSSDQRPQCHEEVSR